MPVHLKSVRKVAVVGWDINVVKGTHASMQAEGEEKRNVDNDGESNLFFPADFSGSVEVTIAGSKSGEEKGTIEIA